MTCRVARVTWLHVCLVVSAVAAPAYAGTYTEHFTTTAFKNTVNTTADWNTALGELRLFPLPDLRGSYNTPGAAYGVAVDGDLAFVGDDLSGLQIVDISNPAGPVLLGSYNTDGHALGVAVAGDLVFVADYGPGLVIVDISDPANPSLVGSYDTPGWAYDVAVDGDLAFVADYASGLQIVDISDPASPTLAGSFDTPGNARGVAVAGDLAFVADEVAGLQIIDITNPASPALAGSYDTPGNARGVAVTGDLAFVADDVAGLQIIDVTNPASPALAGSCDTPGNARGVAVTGDLAFVADEDSGLQVVDITNPTTPALVGSCDTPDNARSIALSGDLAFVADRTSGLQIVGILELTGPALVGSYDTAGFAMAVAVAGDLAVVADGRAGLQIVDVSDPANPSLVGSYDTPGYGYDVAAAGDLAFVADHDGAALRIVSISDPASPVLVGSCHTPGLALGVAVAGDFAFVASQTGGLQIVDISDPATPVLFGSYYGPGMAFDVAVAGDFAFMAEYTVGLLVVNIANPASPALVGSYDTPGEALGVAVAGDLAFVADGYAGLQILNITNPASPALVSSYDTAGEAWGVAVAGDLVFVADYSSGGLLILDIANPASPALVGYYYTPAHACGVATAGDFALVANGDSGLQVIQVFQHEVKVHDNTGQSLAVDGAGDVLLKGRLTTTQTANVTWELSADGGTSFQPFTPGAGWTAFTVPGDDLLWRSTHTWSPGLNPTVSDVTLEWLNEFALITSVADIPNDQGRQVRVQWRRSGRDFVGDPQQIVEYAIYRRIDGALAKRGLAAPSPLPDDLSLIVRENAERMQAAGWDFVTTVPVRVQDDYAVVVPTLADSTLTEGQHYTTFMVSALTSAPGVFFDSPPDSGYSMDNLAPGVPLGFAAIWVPGGVALSWNSAPERDFQYFRVYRSTDPGFVPGPETLVHETASTSWQDSPPDPGSVYYKLAALDFAGNESAPASSGSVTAVGDAPGVPAAFALRSAMPNPARAGTRIAFDLPFEARVSLEVFDVSGRRVCTLVHESLPAGRHEVAWDGADEDGRPVAAGIYLYRLRAGDFESTQRLALVR